MGRSDPGDARTHRVIALPCLGWMQLVANGQQQADKLKAVHTVHAISVSLSRCRVSVKPRKLEAAILLLAIRGIGKFRPADRAGSKQV